MPEEGEKFTMQVQSLYKNMSLYVTIKRGSLNTTTQYPTVFSTTLSQTR